MISFIGHLSKLEKLQIAVKNECNLKHLQEYGRNFKKLRQLQLILPTISHYRSVSIYRIY